MQARALNSIPTLNLGLYTLNLGLFFDEPVIIDAEHLQSQSIIRHETIYVGADGGPAWEQFLNFFGDGGGAGGNKFVSTTFLKNFLLIKVLVIVHPSARNH
jgi:hypothetical protein